jgi:hypothetical protein
MSSLGSTTGMSHRLALKPIVPAVSDFRLPFFFVGSMLVVSAWVIHRKVP